MSHEIDVCLCGAVVRRCRCPGPHDRRVVQMSCAKCINAPPSMVVNVQRLLLIEEQAKRVARAERWHRWARRAHYGIAYGDPEWRGSGIGNAFALAIAGLDAERRKLAEMVGEGDES